MASGIRHIEPLLPSGAVTATLTDSAVVVFAADLPTLVLGMNASATMLLASSAPTSSVAGLDSAVLKTSSDGAAFWPTATTGGKVILAAAAPDMIPVDLAAGIVKLTAGPPVVYPVQILSARLLLSAGIPSVYPLEADTAKLLLIGNAPEFTQTFTIGLRTSAVLLLRGDLPTVTPPPTPTATGMRVNAVA